MWHLNQTINKSFADFFPLFTLFDKLIKYRRLETK